MHLVYKNGIWRTKLAFHLQICSFQFTNKHLALQTGISDYNSAFAMDDERLKQGKTAFGKDYFRELLESEYSG